MGFHGFNIGGICFGIRWWDKHLWKRYIIPHNYYGKGYKHNYFEYYYRWLVFYWCKPRKCELCGNYVTSTGGVHIWDKEGDKILITLCKPCYESSKFGWLQIPHIYKGDKQCLTCKKAHNSICQILEHKNRKCTEFEDLLQ